MRTSCTLGPTTVAILAALTSMACHSRCGECRERAEDVPRAEAVTPFMAGHATFANVNNKASHIQIQLFGGYTTVLVPGEKAKIDEVEVFGHPGWAAASVVTSHPSIDKFQDPGPAWKRSIITPWDGCQKYTLVVRYQVTDELPGHFRHYQVDRPAFFLHVKGSDAVAGAFVPSLAGPGQSNSTASATGTFSGGQGLCFYDIDVYYVKRVTMIEVYAGNAGVSFPPGPNDDTYLILRDTSGYVPQSGGSNWIKHLGDEPYDGTTPYKMFIRVTFQNPTNNPPEGWLGTFDHLDQHQGTPIPLDE